MMAMRRRKIRLRSPVVFLTVAVLVLLLLLIDSHDGPAAPSFVAAEEEEELKNDNEDRFQEEEEQQLEDKAVAAASTACASSSSLPALLPLPLENQQQTTYRVGVLAIRGFDAAVQEFQATFKDYLTHTAGARFAGATGIQFEMVPLNFVSLFESVALNTTTGLPSIDFMYVNPSAFSCLESEYGASSLTSQISNRKVNGESYNLSKFGGVITVRADSNIQTIDDIHDQVVAAASISGLGSGQMQFRLLEQHGISYIQAPQQLVFTSNQGKVVNGVLDGTFDVGFVRTDQIERTKTTNGTFVDASLLRIIEPIPNLTIDAVPFPFQSSTELYPEWNLAALNHVPDVVATQVQQAMYAIQDQAEIGYAILDCYATHNCTNVTGTGEDDPDCVQHCHEANIVVVPTNEEEEVDAECAPALLAGRRMDPVEIALSAATAKTNGKYTGWRTTLSYMDLRNMQEETKFIRKDATDGSMRCIRSKEIYDAIVCPPGHFRKKKAEVQNGCLALGLPCGDGFQCLCRPCVKSYDVDVFPVAAVVDSEQDEDASVGCSKMSLCGSTRQKQAITFHAVDNKKRDDMTMTAIVHSGNDDESREIIANRVVVPAGKNSTTNTSSASTYTYEFDVIENTVGVIVLEVLTNGEQIPESPLRIEIKERDCQYEFNDPLALLVATEDGRCVCDATSIELGASDGGIQKVGRCVPKSTIIAATVIPLAIFLAIGIYVYITEKQKAADSVWHVKEEELLFDDPPEVAGRGTFGLVLMAEYRGTTVAVKRVIPPKKQASSTTTTKSLTTTATDSYDPTTSSCHNSKDASNINGCSVLSIRRTSLDSGHNTSASMSAQSSIGYWDQDVAPRNSSSKSTKSLASSNRQLAYDAFDAKLQEYDPDHPTFVGGIGAGKPIVRTTDRSHSMSSSGSESQQQERHVSMDCLDLEADLKTTENHTSITNSRRNTITRPHLQTIASGRDLASGSQDALTDFTRGSKSSHMNSNKGKVSFSSASDPRQQTRSSQEISMNSDRSNTTKSLSYTSGNFGTIDGSNKSYTNDGGGSGTTSGRGVASATSYHGTSSTLSPGTASFKRFPISIFNRKDSASREYSKLKSEFIIEMRHLSKLRHPCITTVMGAIIEKNVEPMLIMEFMDMGSLYDILHNESFPLDGDLLLPILRDIAQGVRFLHAATPQVIHGDLKAQNVLVDGKFRAKVADFGLSAKKVTGATGTPYWMAPELFRGQSNTSASDVYSFGIILYEVYSRKEPYENEDYESVIRDVADVKINKRPPIPTACPERVASIMLDCVDGSPVHRPSFEEIDLRLKRCSVEDIEPGEMHLSYQARKQLKSQRDEDFIYRIFPKSIADQLREGRKPEPEKKEMVTIFFSDIVGYTTISSKIQPEDVCDMLDRLYSKFDALAKKHGVFKLETIGDAFIGVANLVEDQAEDHAKRVAEFALDCIQASSETPIVNPYNEHGTNIDLGPVQIRVGLHCGPVIASVVGSTLPKYVIIGDTVNVTARMESNSQTNKIHCTEFAATILQRQAPNLDVHKRGTIAIKGKGEMTTYWVDPGKTVQDDDDRMEGQQALCPERYLPAADGGTKTSTLGKIRRSIKRTLSKENVLSLTQESTTLAAAGGGAEGSTKGGTHDDRSLPPR